VEADAFEHGGEDLLGAFLGEESHGDDEEEHGSGGELPCSFFAAARVVQNLFENLVGEDSMEELPPCGISDVAERLQSAQ